MKHLKNNSILLSLCLFMGGCQSTPFFNINTFHTDSDDFHVIQVYSNRIRQKCLFLNAEAENNWRHQYLMYILNDKNEVLEIMGSTNQDKDTCYSQVQKIDKLLQSEAQVKICARDKLKNIQETHEQKSLIQFEQLGNHKPAYEALTYDSICSSKKCIGDNSVWVKTCPGFIKH